MAAANLGRLASNRQRAACYGNKKSGPPATRSFLPRTRRRPPRARLAAVAESPPHLTSGLALHLRHQRLGEVGLGLATSGQALSQLAAQGAQCVDTGDDAGLFRERC